MRAPELVFRDAVAAFQRRDYPLAERLCRQLLDHRALPAEAAHMLALISKLQGDLKSARAYFERSIAADPRQAPVLSNFGNLLAQAGDHERAEEMYRRATRTDATQADAWYNWVSLLNADGRHSEAAGVAGRAIEANPADARLRIALGLAARGLEDFAASIAALERALELAPLPSALGVIAVQQKAITLRTANEPARAAACLDALAERGIESPETCFIKACCHYDAAEQEQAERELNRSIDLQPDYPDAHEALNKLYWERGDDANFLESYRRCIPKVPQSRRLRYSHAAQLIMAGRADAAAAALREAIEACGPAPELVHALGVVAMRKLSLDEALGHFEQAVRGQPDSTRFRIDRANVLIRFGEYGRALEDLETAGQLNPLDQEVWAYKGTCWRLLGDERAEWLNDYDRLVNVSYLVAPEGYDDLEHFMRELRDELERLHQTRRQPIDQSVQNGTQTVGTLLSLQTPVIRQYRRMLSDSIQRYIENLPKDPAHPFFRRNTGKFVHTGSWSVKLGSGGYHTNHVHPKGWLSNCTYISLPSSVREDDPERSGWIKFGETSLLLGDRETIGRSVCPKEGMRVLFPSFMWHGTFPFRSEESRITAPSDIMPRP